MTDTGRAAGPISVLGGGSWGTALARHLALGGERVRLWVREEDLAERIVATRVNDIFLPGFEIPPEVEATPSLEAACDGAAWVLLVVPSRHCRDVLSRVRPHLRHGPRVIVASKGIERRTQLRLTQVVEEVLGGASSLGVAALSGPSFAKEVAAGRPTAVVTAAAEEALAIEVQSLLSRRNLRVYTSSDRIGVEIGGAFKNVVAIAAGTVEGLGLGPNTMAALVTRGLAEISRLAVTLGGRRETLAGLAGMGDLILTCTGAQSRNRHVGFELGRGRSLEEILGGMQMVAEGVETARSGLDLSRRESVPMPITEKVHEVLFQGSSPEQAIRELLQRPPRPECD
jgi:glycerol-3-phosphate dehydrogenase (NAD(P)+)